MLSLRVAVALTIFVLPLSLGASAAHAAVISVNTTADELNSDGDCSLREAFEAANTNSPVDACPAGEPGPTVDVITFGVNGTIAITNGKLVVSDDLSIQGPGGGNLTIAGTGFNVLSPLIEVGAGETLIVDGVTLADNVNGIGPAGIANYGTLTVTNTTFTNNTGTGGSGIGNEGAGLLTVANSTFSGNHEFALGNRFGATGIVIDSTFSGNVANQGGAIQNLDSTLTVNNSTFSGNQALGTGTGGAIANLGGSVLTVTNSTFSGNSADWGGAIYNTAGVTFTNSTISGNSASNSGGAIYNTNSVTLRNTIVARSPSGGNCSGTISDGGGNLSWPDTTCPGINQDPLLGPLANNGGPTETMALREGSPAIDTAVLGNCPATDQRGIARPQGLGCDIGAFEAEATTCTHEGTTLTVNLPAGSNGRIVRSGTAIEVSINGNPVACGSPTVGNVDTIVVNGTIQTELLQLDLSGGRFEPGASPEGTGTSEIEVQVDLGAGSDTVVVDGTSAADTFRLGTVGANLNADDDGDDITLAGVEAITVNGAGGTDKLSAEGGLATGSPLMIPLLLNGDVGNDKLTGGTLNDVMNGGAGKDTCNALKTADGSDICNGGSQTDTTSYAKRMGAVSVDPDGAADDGSPGENDTTATDVENLTGGKGGDTLVVTNSAKNVAKGEGGNDTITVIDGISGNDTANGGGGTADSCSSDPGDIEIDCET
jgi:CSLREA domain-containing protein